MSEGSRTERWFNSSKPKADPRYCRTCAANNDWTECITRVFGRVCDSAAQTMTVVDSFELVRDMSMPLNVVWPIEIPMPEWLGHRSWPLRTDKPRSIFPDLTVERGLGDNAVPFLDMCCDGVPTAVPSCPVSLRSRSNAPWHLRLGTMQEARAQTWKE